MASSIFDPSCTRCPLSDRPRAAGLHVCIPGVGPTDADILFYGEAPGAEEEQENKPFVGAAGRELDTLLGRAGLRREDIRVSNPVRCRPPNNRKPTKDEQAACMVYTVRELELVQPKIIVALGGAAFKALTGKEAVGENRGKLTPLLKGYRSDVRVIVTYHPAAYLHNPGARTAYTKAIIDDFKLAKKIAASDSLDATVITPYNASKREIRDALALLSDAKHLAVDLEWEKVEGRSKKDNSMWPWSKRNGRLPREICIGIGARVNGHLLAVSLPFDHEYAPRVKAILRRARIYGHNILSDLTWILHLKWSVRKILDDTLIWASLLQYDTSLSLKTLASLHTDMPAGWEEDVDRGVYPRTEAEWAEQTVYNGQDCIATILLREHLRKETKKQNRASVMPLYRHVLLPAVPVLTQTALNGTPIDVVLLRKLQRQCRRRITRLTDKIGRTLKLPANDYEGIINSGARLGPYLEATTGINFPLTRKTGKISITKDTLLQHKNDHPVISLELRRRKWAKQDSSYWTPWDYLLTEQGDRRLHSVYRLTHARTGRTSAQGELGYTFQQFLRGQVARDLVEADEGKLILSVDQSQIELRIIADLANERRMKTFFANHAKYPDDKKWDLHYAIAGFMRALEAGWSVRRYVKNDYTNMERWVNAVTKEERTGAKPVNFGLGFGGSWGVIQRTARQDYGMELSQATCETGYEAYHLFYPDIKPWQDGCWQYVEQGWVETPLHRIRDLGILEGEDEEGKLRKAINTPVQATASDLSVFCTVYTWELLRKEYGKHLRKVAQNIGFFHDADLIMFDQREQSAVHDIVKLAWEKPPLERLEFTLSVPLEADIKIGPRWEA